jgi:hypothetical protein
MVWRPAVVQLNLTACRSRCYLQEQQLKRSRSSSSWTQQCQQLLALLNSQGQSRIGVLWSRMLQKHPSMTPRQQQQQQEQQCRSSHGT